MEIVAHLALNLINLLQIEHALHDKDTLADRTGRHEAWYYTSFVQRDNDATSALPVLWPVQ
jgi:hypothetical protein